MSNKKLKAIAFAALMVLSVVGMVATAGAAGVDSETTTTATTSELTDGATVTNFNASDTDQLPTLQATYATQKPELQIIDPATGTTIETFTNSSNPDYFTSTGGTGPYYYNTTFNESDFGDVPMASGANKSVTIRIIDNSSLADPGSADMHNITVYLENVDGRTVLRAGTSSTTLSTIGGEFAGLSIPLIGGEDKPTATFEKTGVAVNGSGSTVTLALTNEGDNTSIADRFSQAADGHSGTDRITGMYAKVNGNYHPVYQEGNVPSSVDSTMTYGVYDSAEDDVEMNIGDQYSDASTVDVTVVANNALPPWTSSLNFGILSGLPFIGAAALLVITGYGRRRIESDE